MLAGQKKGNSVATDQLQGITETVHIFWSQTQERIIEVTDVASAKMHEILEQAEHGAPQSVHAAVAHDPAGALSGTDTAHPCRRLPDR